MTDAAKLEELALRCEQTTGPDRELDMLIDCALKGIEVVYPTEGHPLTPGRGGRIVAKGTFELLGWIDPGEAQRNFSPYGGDNAHPKFTASLDAAMLLVPPADRWPWNVTMATFYRSASVIPNHGESYGISDPYAGHSRGVAATPILALCAAALRAQAATQKGGADA